MRNSIFILALLIFGLCMKQSQASEGQLIELADYMTRMQYFTHKLQLSIEANNSELAKFYVYELKEAIGPLKRIRDYEGHKISSLVAAYFMPAFKAMDKAIQDEELPLANERFSSMLVACNSCHASAKHGFIKIKRNSSNPYMQDFSPEK